MKFSKLPAGRKIIQITQQCFLANQPLLLVGDHGVGKSELFGQAAAGLGIECIPRDLQHTQSTVQ